MPNPLSLGFLLLPLIGGYLFLKAFNPSRYYFRSTEGHGLFFAAASAGVVLLGLAQVLAVELRDYEPGRLAYELVKRYAPFAHSGAAIGALALGLVAGALLDILFWPSRTVWFIAKRTDDLLYLLLQAQREKGAALLTLNNGKCYVGYILDVSKLRLGSSYIKILPLHSGYRKTETLHLELPTFYEDSRGLVEAYYAGRDMDEEDLQRLHRLQIVLRKDSIFSASFFNPSVYKKHYEVRNPPDNVVR